MANEEVDFIPYAELTPELKELVDSPDWSTKKNAVSRGLGLDMIPLTLSSWRRSVKMSLRLLMTRKSRYVASRMSSNTMRLQTAK